MHATYVCKLSNVINTVALVLLNARHIIAQSVDIKIYSNSFNKLCLKLT